MTGPEDSHRQGAEPVPGPAAEGSTDLVPGAARYAVAGLPTGAPPGGPEPQVVVRFDRRNVWRAAWVAVAVVAIAALGKFVLDDGGGVIFTLIMSMLAAIAMEPAVARLSQRMRRGVATALVMLGTILFVVVFLFAFGQLLADQLSTLVRAIPGLVEDAAAWAQQRFNISIDYRTVLDELGIGTSALASAAQNLAGGLVGAVAAVLAAFFSTFTFAFFTFYFSADQPRLRRWLARLAPPREQEVMTTAWKLAVIKTGGYVSARLVLAAICGGLSAAFMLIIGMPYWLALGIWTGLVAQFVPTVGTYIAIALPVFVGLIGPQPWQGLAMLGFALVYQQIENVTLEPKISAQAVDVHPAVSFASVMFGASLFGVAGAFVAVPVAALMLALFEIYTRKYELLPQLAERQPGERPPGDAEGPPGGEQAGAPGEDARVGDASGDDGVPAATGGVVHRVRQRIRRA